MKKITLSLIAFFTMLASVYAQDFTGYEPPQGKYYTINGYKLWVEVEGKGQPLFLISGGPGGSHHGMHSFCSLRDSFMLVYVDYLGRGASDTAKKREEYTIDRDVDDVEGVRKALKLDKIIVLGHSYGSLVAQGYALKYPDKTSKLIIANGFHSGWMWQENCDNSNRCIKSGYPEVWKPMMKLREQGIVSSDTAHINLYGMVPYGFLYTYSPDNLKKGFRSATHKGSFNTDVYYQMVGRDGDFIISGCVGDFDVRKKLKNLNMPVYVIAGRYDRVATPEMIVLYKEYCPQAKFVMFEKSGHNPQIEEYESYFEILRSFLRK